MKSNKFRNSYNILGKLISKTRKSFKISQNELASKMQLMGINIGKNEISKIECGKRLLRDYELIAIKDILDLDINNIHL